MRQLRVFTIFYPASPTFPSLKPQVSGANLNGVSHTVRFRVNWGPGFWSTTEVLLPSAEA